jgi:hypothetical protein
VRQQPEHAEADDDHDDEHALHRWNTKSEL